MGCAAKYGPLVAALAACRNTSAPEISGAFSIDGMPLAVSDCRPTRSVVDGLTVELAVEGGGRLRFHRAELAYDGQPLPCTRLVRSWGGGARNDGTAYWRGTLDFTCVSGGLAMVGKLALDCGNITPEEHASLDKNRAETLKEQGSGTP